jgi:hypothetical protein
MIGDDHDKACGGGCKHKHEPHTDEQCSGGCARKEKELFTKHYDDYEILKEEIQILKAENESLRHKPLTGYKDIDEFLRGCLSTMHNKGHDYREGNDDDLLHNFRTVGEDMNLSPEKVWYIYASKHWKAIKTFIKEGGQSESEPIDGRIKDMIVYLLLLYRRTEDMKRDKVKHFGEIAKKADAVAASNKRLEKIRAEVLRPTFEELENSMKEKAAQWPKDDI